MKRFGLIVAIILGLVALLAIEALIVMGLWNWVIVGLFDAKVISFWLALGVVFVLDLIANFFKSKNKSENKPIIKIRLK